MIRATRNFWRLLAIGRILSRYDALVPFEWMGLGAAAKALRLLSLRKVDDNRRPGERLALALQELGPSFIKLGQGLSTRADLMGEEVAADLSTLQDRVPPFSGTQARVTVERELGQPLDALFAEFNEKPVAAASIAQVHFAVTREDDGTKGEEVAVKVLRPDIEAALARDLDLFRWVARIIERTQPQLRRLKLSAAVETFSETIAMELDMRLEAAAASELASNFKDDPSYLVPAVDWQRTARRVLTTKRINGIPIDETDALEAAGHNLEQIVGEAARIFFLQVFRDGFFHGDIHPGNLFVAGDGALLPVDFGIMGRVDRPTRRYLANTLMGLLMSDYRRVADAHFRAGYVPAHKSRDAFMQATRAIGEPILGRPTGEISIARLLAQLFQVTRQFEMETQPQLLLLQKAMLLAEGVGRRLTPGVNMWVLAQPLVEDWIAEHLSPEARLGEVTAELAGTVARLPRIVADVERAAQVLAAGSARNHSNNFDRSQGPALWPLWIAIGAVAVLMVLTS